jgi:hypothetical protein
MWQMLRQLRDPDFRREAIARAGAAVRALPLVRRLAAYDREALDDAFGWCAWALAGAMALYAMWVVGGFSALVGQAADPAPASRRQIVRAAPAESPADGCTQAALDRSIAARCRQAPQPR